MGKISELELVIRDLRSAATAIMDLLNLQFQREEVLRIEASSRNNA